MARDERLTEEGQRDTRSSRRRQSQASLHAAEEAEAPGLDERDEAADMEEGELADDDRFAAFLDAIDAKVLPDLPEMPGFHVCWLSTTSQHDTIIKRRQMGYELVTPDMVPGWNALDMYLKSASHPGVVSLNEMVAARIPERLYQRYMRELHHRRPLSEEEKVRANTQAMAEKALEVGGRLIEGDGMSELIQRAPEPRFAS